MSHIVRPVNPKCYAIMWSYGEICCHSNCCGQFGKGLKMWRARLRYHKENLKRALAFNNWLEGIEEYQKKNQKYSITYEKRKIKYCQQKIAEWKIK